MKKRPNLTEKRQRKSAELRTFMQEYARKAHPGFDPNDRRYDRRLERKIKHMKPEGLDRLLREDDDE